MSNGIDRLNKYIFRAPAQQGHFKKYILKEFKRKKVENKGREGGRQERRKKKGRSVRRKIRICWTLSYKLVFFYCYCCLESHMGMRHWVFFSV